MEPVKPRAYVATFGCRVNQADTEGILSTLVDRGFDVADDHRGADLVVVNSCTVTHRSDADIRKLVHRIQRERPEARVIVTGCYAQRDPGALAALAGAHAVVGNAQAEVLADVARQLVDAPPPEAPIVAHSAFDALTPDDLPPVRPVSVAHDRTRPFVKIQDGCDAKCTYCVIPEVRGPARSAAVDAVVRSVGTLVENGAFEVVLAGIHLGTYRGARPLRDVGDARDVGDVGDVGDAATDDGGPADLADLVAAVLAVPGLGRLRLSAIEPMAFPTRLIDLAAADRRLARHFHLPLQSGADGVLKRMNRPYRQRDYAALLGDVRAALPEACLGTDVIVGFPGETDADFAETLAFVERSGLDHVHVFSYSDRPGVPSTRLRGKVGSAAIKARARALIALSDRLWARFLDRHVGETIEALALERAADRPERVACLSGNYLPIEVADDDARPIAANENLTIRVEARRGDGLVGRVLARPEAPRRLRTSRLAVVA